MSSITNRPSPAPVPQDVETPETETPAERPSTGGTLARPAPKSEDKVRSEVDRLARAAAAEAGVDHIEMKGTREEILARLAQYEWKPSDADVKYVETATANAAAEKMVKNERVGGKVFFTEPAVDVNKAANTEMYKALIGEIKTAKKIHAALYGIDKVPELIDELRKAKARGAEIKIVVDQNADGTFTYPETEQLVKEFGLDCFRVEKNSKYAIMHDKFWIFDDKKVWTGSTNINKSAVGKGYNNEISILMNSKNLAAQFEAEHAQMWAGKFHKQKVDNTLEELKAAGGVTAQVFFSPTDNAIEQGIIPLIKDAEKSIHLSLFHFSDPNIANEILAKHKAGVDVKLIIDATGAANKATHANVELLRAAGIPVKIENWGGKQHMKGGVVDGKGAVIGSMNWTASGMQRNDENCMVIRNHPGLGGAMEEQFQKSFKTLPELTLFGYFAAEGLNSIGSMTDGSDNDHFGGKDAFLSWKNYTKALGEIDTAAHKMAAVQGPDAAIKAKVEALQILQGEVNKAKERLTGAQGTSANAAIDKIQKDLDDQKLRPRL
jgi:phosphatidylserine/phosphatidylglycerophosphate/cardiolipin synthase-like enzyme